MKYLNLLIIAVLLLATACKHKEAVDTNSESTFDPSDTVKVAPLKKDTAHSNVKVSTVGDTALADQVKPKLAEQSKTDEVKIKNDNRYYLIVGSFKDLQNSKKLSKSLDGSEILEGKNSFQRVAKAAFETKKEAIKALKLYRKQHTKKAAWLLHQ